MAGHLRIRYGMAYGRENNFYSGVAGQKGYLAGTDGLLAQANTSPDVTYGTQFYTNNSAATTINSFQLNHPSFGNGNLAGLFEGKVIRILFLDSNTTVQGPAIYMSGTDNTFNQRGFLELMYHGSAWYETSRMNPYTTTSILVGGSFGANVVGVEKVVVNGSGASWTLQSLSGGVFGQRVLVINNNSSLTFSVSTIGNIIYSTVAQAGSAFVGIMSVSASGGTVELVKTAQGNWCVIGAYR